MEKKRDSFFLSKKPEKNAKHNEKKRDFNGEKKREFNNEKKRESNNEKRREFNNEKKKEYNNKKKKDFNNKRKEQFDMNRDVENQEDKEKKPFDKKTYRLKKYSKKYKLEQWEEQRKNKLLRTYYKDVKNDPAAGSYKPKGFDEDTTDASEVGRFVRHPDLIEKEEKGGIFQKKKDPYHKAKEQLNKLKEEKLQKQQEIAKIKEEKQQKLQEYKKKKQERFKKLSKKTKRGQPVMTGRLELLLEKIQKGSN